MDKGTVITNERNFRITPIQQMISTCTGALITSTIVTPLDVVKIRLQTQQKILLTNRCFLYCNGLMDHICECVNGQTNAWVKRPVPHYNSTIDAFSKIIRNEGIVSLWSGLPPTLIMAIPATITYFVTYEQLRVWLHDKYTEKTGNISQPLWIPLVSGAVARTWAVTIVNPLELVRTKMQSKKLTYKEVRGACRSLMESRGISGFWLGWTPTIMRDVPFSAIYWGSYEGLKKLGGQTNQPSIGFSFMAGATAGSIAGIVTLPFDVVKTHRQLELGDLNFAVRGMWEGKTLSTTMSIMKRIYKSNGVSGLFTGYVPRIVKVAPACAIMISTYEYGKSFFVRYNMEQNLKVD